MSILLYGCIMWMLTKLKEIKLNDDCIRCYKPYWTDPGSNIPQNTCDMITYDVTYIYIYIYIHTHIYVYIYCHSQRDGFVVSQRFSVAKLVGRLRLGLNPTQLYVRLSILPLRPQVTYVSSGIIRHYVVAFVCSYFALREWQPLIPSPECSTPGRGELIYCHS